MIGELRDVCIDLGERPDLASCVSFLLLSDVQQSHHRAQVLTAALADVRHKARVVADDELPGLVALTFQGRIFDPAATIRREGDKVLTRRIFMNGP